jgi:hypothetical protein
LATLTALVVTGLTSAEGFVTAQGMGRAARPLSARGGYDEPASSDGIVLAPVLHGACGGSIGRWNQSMTPQHHGLEGVPLRNVSPAINRNVFAGQEGMRSQVHRPIDSS